MTGITIPKGWFKNKNSKSHRHPRFSAISSPSTATGSSSIPSRPRQASASSAGSFPLAQLESTMTTLTNRSSTGMTAVSSTSGLGIFLGPNSPPSQGCSPPQPRASSSPSLPYSYSSAHATSTAHINRSHSSLPSGLSHNNNSYNNTDQGQPPSRHSTPATKPPSKQLEQLKGTHPPQHQISETSWAKNGHSPTAQKQNSVSQALVHGPDAQAQTQTQRCAPQPKARFLARSYTQKYQPNKILRNLSARFGSSTDMLPVVEVETVVCDMLRGTFPRKPRDSRKSRKKRWNGDKGKSDRPTLSNPHYFNIWSSVPSMIHVLLPLPSHPIGTRVCTHDQGPVANGRRGGAFPANGRCHACRARMDHPPQHHVPLHRRDHVPRQLFSTR